MNILFPYMARWHAVNWTRYHSLLWALADDGHVVHVLQTPPRDSRETNFQEIARREHPNIHLHDVALHSGLWNRQVPLDKLVKKAYFSLAALSSARRLIETEHIDVLLLYNIPQYRFLALDVPVTVFDYADDYVEMLGHELGRLNNPLARALARSMLYRMMARATIVTAVSHVLAHEVRGAVYVIPNGVSLAKASARPSSEIHEIRNGGKPVVGYVGAFEYFIDLDMIFNVAQAMPEMHFLLVGSGRDWAGFAERVRRAGLGNVQLTGGVPHDHVFEYIRQMDVCLNLFRPIPVSHRACPIKLFEYLSQTKPVVSTRLDEIAHIDDGFLYFGDSTEEVCDQVRHILAHPEEAAHRAQHGYKVTVDRYTWEAIARQLVAAIAARKPQIA